jgi:hypothetical protein
MERLDLCKKTSNPDSIMFPEISKILGDKFPSLKPRIRKAVEELGTQPATLFAMEESESEDLPPIKIVEEDRKTLALLLVDPPEETKKKEEERRALLLEERRIARERGDALIRERTKEYRAAKPPPDPPISLTNSRTFFANLKATIPTTKQDDFT